MTHSGEDASDYLVALNEAMKPIWVADLKQAREDVASSASGLMTLFATPERVLTAMGRGRWSIGVDLGPSPDWTARVDVLARRIGKQEATKSALGLPTLDDLYATLKPASGADVVATSLATKLMQRAERDALFLPHFDVVRDALGRPVRLEAR